MRKVLLAFAVEGQVSRGDERYLLFKVKFFGLEFELKFIFFCSHKYIFILIVKSVCRLNRKGAQQESVDSI